MVLRKKKGFFTKVGEVVRGEPIEVTRDRQRAFTKERRIQASRVGSQRAKLQAEAQIRRERERLNPPKNKSRGSSMFDFNPAGSPTLRDVPIRTQPRRVVRRRRRLSQPRRVVRRRRRLPQQTQERPAERFDVIGF